MKRIVLLLSTAFLLLSFTQSALSQHASITGVAMDSSSRQVMEYASVSLYKASDSTLIAGALTDASGKFVFSRIKAGRYYLSLQFIGYNTCYSPTIQVKEDASFNLGTLFIEPAKQLLGEVTVSSRKVGAYHKIDKQVYKANEFAAAKGGTALDVIKNMPSVSVNGQGEITLRGSGGFLVLLNGRAVQSGIQELLNQLPANAIENIELITAPSAKYDPDGKAGIINITTKKGYGEGLSVGANLQGGLPSFRNYNNNNTARRFGTDATLHYKKGKWDLSLGGNYLRNDLAGYREGNVYTITDSYRTDLPSNGERSFKRYNYGGRAAIAFTPNKFNSFNIGLYKSSRAQGRTADIRYQITQTQHATGNIARRNVYFNENLQQKNGSFSLASIDYNHTFKNLSTLTAALLYEKANLSGFTQNNNLYYPKTTDTLQYTYNTNTNPLTAYRARLDYATPLAGGKLEAGYQYRSSVQDGNFIYETKVLGTAQFTRDPEFTSGVWVDHQVHSLYSQYSGKAKKLDYTGGLRYEHAKRLLQFYGDPLTRYLSLSNLFPSLNLMYALQNRWKLKAGYSRRVQRTNNFELNPLPEREHSETLEQGDPNLLPEFINLQEAGVIKELRQGVLSATLYHQGITNPIQRVNKVYNDTILNRVFTNAGKASLWGMEASLNIKPTNRWQLYTGLNLYHYAITGSIFDGQLPVKNSDVVFSINANSSFQLTPSINLQGNVNYLAARPTAQGKDGAFLSPNLSVNKELWKGRLSAQLQWQNIDLGVIKSNRQRITTWGTNFYTTTNYIYESDVVMLHLSINLNQRTKKAKLPVSEFGEKEF